MRGVFSFLILLFGFFASAQQEKDSIVQDVVDGKKADSLFFSKKEQKKDVQPRPITIADYKIISLDRDTTAVDTSLTLKKEYSYNFLRKDDFELMPFANIGQPYNKLGVDLRHTSLYPNIGASAKHFGYFEVEDVPYYDVPTPLTELFFKTTLEQGQLLDALITLNTSRRFNFSLAFKGFRSLGKYQFEQAESASFRATFNYRTANNRYAIRGHYVSQDLESEENGGLSNLEQFESGDEDFLDRSRIDVVFNNADNRILGKRYFFDHQLNLIRSRRDSLNRRSTQLSIGHRFNYESKFYQFNQSTTNSVFGTSFVSPIADRASLKTTFNQLSVNFSNRIWGNLSANANLYNYQYFFNSILITDTQTIPNGLDGNEIALGADYNNVFGRFALKGKVRYNVSGSLTGTLFDGEMSYAFDEDTVFRASIHGSSRAPNFNFLLYQSDYENFNWRNDFERQQVQTLAFGFDSKLLGNLDAQYSSLDNYTYFGLSEDITAEDVANNLENAFVRPFQETSTISHLKIKYQKEFRYKKWALNNTVMYQNVTQDNQVLNVPDFVTRNTLYFSSDIFKKAMYIQTGVTLKYFTSYNLDAYHPLLGEFFVQNLEEQGAFPLIDLFINARVRQTRIYLKAEHLNTIWTQNYNFYAAPNYPYRDFVIRFGLVWNFFS